MALSHVRIVGSGLIGTSIGLALVAKGVSVTMEDIDSNAARLAQDLIGVEVLATPADLTVIASPISTISAVINEDNQRDNHSGLNLGFIDISSVKVKPVLDVHSINFDMSKFLPTHPMAGREVGGAESARADLFQDRPWAIDPAGVSGPLLAAGRELIELCGGNILEIPVEEHDQAVALVSHLPQIVSSLLASQLEGAPAEWLDLAGSGLRDTTRIAASSPTLWREIISANSQALVPLIDRLIEALRDLNRVLATESSSELAVEEFIKAGNRGRAMIPGKHGGVARNYSFLPVVIEDKPGQLAALFDECASAQVNVEDLSIEHSPEQYTGLITLALSQADATKLHEHLLQRGWRAHAPR